MTATAVPTDRADGSHRAALCEVLGRYATGVVIITTVYGGRNVGLTVNSFTSLSLEPPLVLWCLNKRSATYTAFTTAEPFAVNVLAADQRDLAIRFTGLGERFRGTTVRTGRFGLPILAGTVATLICRRHRLVPAGDHIVVIGGVEEYQQRPGPTLLFQDGGYRISSATPAT
ncbi:MAG: hypothetical protein AUI14_08170 [Actinobacteria bacterium 13_2_20CM_2_71_6]|nr:MAG: hypothetical protein AUI14_08170 [Actinobacteria bacterium 13_2_20CM_2_71_6]